MATQADTKFCYYDSLAARRPGKGRFEVGNIDPYACTHVAYAFVGVTENGLVGLGDPFVDVLQGNGLSLRSCICYRSTNAQYSQEEYSIWPR